jgi:hypothetical protein
MAAIYAVASLVAACGVGIAFWPLLGTAALLLMPLGASAGALASAIFFTIRYQSGQQTNGKSGPTRDQRQSAFGREMSGRAPH